MALSDIINLQISVAANYPSGPSFSLPLLATYHTQWPELTRTYSNLQGLITDGFTTSSPTYQMASRLLGTVPRVPQFKVGRRQTAYTQVTHLTVLSAGAVTGVVFSFTVGGQPITYTVPGSSTTSTVATALAALITTAAPTGLATAVGASAVITLTSNAGALVDVNWTNMPTPPRTLITVADATSDGSGGVNFTNDMAAILNADNNWYGFAVDSNGFTEIEAGCAFAESNTLNFYWNTMDTLSATSTSTSNNIMPTLAALSYARDMGLFSGTQLLSYSGVAMMGNQFSQYPGAATNAFKTLPGVPIDQLTESEFTTINANNGNSYSNQTGGAGYTYNGISPSGEFFDIVRGLDWMRSTMQVNLIGLLANNPKISYTDAGIAQVQNVIQGVLDTASKNPYNILAASPAPTITVPTAASISSAQKATRILPNVFFTATLAGAIQGADITGTVTA